MSNILTQPNVSGGIGREFKDEQHSCGLSIGRRKVQSDKSPNAP